MSKEPEKTSEEMQTGSHDFTEAEISQARQCFQRAQHLAEGKNYDYAIEWYMNGLEIWPEAVEEGHKPCRAAALFRGGKKASFMEARKYKTNVKDPKTAMLNAEMLLSKEPYSLSHMEAIFKNAARGGFLNTMMWIGEIFFDTLRRKEKPSMEQLKVLRKHYEELADKMEDQNPALAIQTMERAVQALGKLNELKPQDMEISTDLRDVAGKLTILKGKYSSAESFRDSVQDAESQAALRDKERAVQSENRMSELIVQAEQKYQADPTDRATINQLADLLVRREETDNENKAIDILLKAHQEIKDYRFKFRADDIRMKQLNREARRLLDSGDSEQAREKLKDKLRFEIKTFKERCKQYPSDMRMRYEFGRRLFQAKHYDEAIPVLQEARSDPKTRQHCSLYIGQCFFKKGYYIQAEETFQDAIEHHEVLEDELGKQLHYWLGRAFEEDNKPQEALKIYGQLIQWDYNYAKGDVRKRIDALRNKGKTESD